MCLKIRHGGREDSLYQRFSRHTGVSEPTSMCYHSALSLFRWMSSTSLHTNLSATIHLYYHYIEVHQPSTGKFRVTLGCHKCLSRRLIFEPGLKNGFTSEVSMHLSCILSLWKLKVLCQSGTEALERLVPTIL